MRDLTNFLLKNSSWFLFILLELICFYFILNQNAYQKSVYLNSSNSVVGRVYTLSGNVSSYFGLRQQNDDLLQKNAELQSLVLSLKDYIHTTSIDSVKTEAFLKDSLHHRAKYEFIIAQVVYNTVSQADNFVTISKGAKAGIKIDMGVISERGIVGVVRAVSDNFSIIQPILNSNTKFVCKTIKSNAFGTLSWDGKDARYANVNEYPKYEEVNKGDTIVTSGFSKMFPEGVLVGVVEDFKSQTDDNFYSLKVKLSTDFRSLKNVLIIKNNTALEQNELEQKVSNAKK